MNKHKKIKPDQLGPKIAEGFTDSPLSPEEARREFPVRRDPKAPLSHMHGGTMPGTRVPRPTMFLKANETIIEEPNTGRKFQDVDQIITPDMRGAILDGRMCLKCKEPFDDSPWPDNCVVCGYEAKQRQVADAELELLGTQHLGPARPIQMFMDDLEERSLKRQFAQEHHDGFKGGLKRAKVAH